MSNEMVINKRQRTKTIFNKNVAQSLINNGCTLIKMENHKDKQNWIVFYFLDDAHFRKQLSLLTLSIRNDWKEKQAN